MSVIPARVLLWKLNTPEFLQIKLWRVEPCQNRPRGFPLYGVYNPLPSRGIRCLVTYLWRVLYSSSPSRGCFVMPFINRLYPRWSVVKEVTHSTQRIYKLNSRGFDFIEITLEGFSYDLHITLFVQWGGFHFLTRGGIGFMLTIRPVHSGVFHYHIPAGALLS